MFKSPLFRRFFYLILSTVTVFAVVVSVFSVPYLREMVYRSEERSAQTIINDVYELIQANYRSNTAYEKSVTEAEKRQLKNLTVFLEAYIREETTEVTAGTFGKSQGQRHALESLRELRYGSNDYVWVADQAGRYLSHPDPAMNGMDFSEVRDVFGNYVLTPLIEAVREKGEGFHTFWWHRLGDDLPVRKLAYARLFPEWEWVIGTGVYLDDLEAEIALRKEKLIDELRETLNRINRQHEGKIQIFDSFENIIIHPDRELENTTFPEETNLLTNHRLVDDLMKAGRTIDGKLRYRWRPEAEKAAGVREAIAWTKYVSGFDWFVVFSIETSALNAGALQLQNRIIAISVLITLLSIAVIAFFVNRLIRPIQRLSKTATLVESGDLTARFDVTTRDEIGLLASAFNGMVNRLSGYIEALDQKVLERTRELDEKNEKLEQEVAGRKRVQEELSQANEQLTGWVGRLEEHNREISLLNRMDELLQACHSLDETFPIVAETMHELFPRSSGTLYVLGDGSEVLRTATAWGGPRTSEPRISSDHCWALRLRKIHVVEKPGPGHRCGHVTASEPFLSFCLPLLGRNEIIGLLHLCIPVEPSRTPLDENRVLTRARQLTTAVTDHLSMAQANIKLRERLHRLSVRDGLTGLFNRRYMEETLTREFQKARRNEGACGVLMLDVDHFKSFNDNHGHEAGDLILVELASLLAESVRGGDVVCRFGGEEFVIILPDAVQEQAAARAEAIRDRVERDLRVDSGEKTLRVTVSIGVGVFPAHGDTSEAVLKAADEALYRAKAEGRNRIVVA